jgi:antitoxin VapB
MNTAKVFWSGRSQAVRLPRDFRFNTKEVRIHREGNSVVLEPVADNWGWLEAICGKLDEDFVHILSEQVQSQERPELDEFFK